MFIARLIKVAILLSISLTSSAQVAGENHPISLWQVDGLKNQVYLLGSVHLLREEDHPLPSAIYDAYGAAEKLVMELDMDDMDPVETQALANELGLIQDDRSLADYLGAAAFAEAEALALSTDIPLNLLSRAEPWYAAMNVEIMLLMRIGFSPALGIETSMLELATSDQKEILGFETMREQLELLDGLSAGAQREMLLQALRDGEEIGNLMDIMIDAWRHGDTKQMEETILSEMQQFPELNQTIVVNRNRNWVGQIEQLLDDEIDYLVIVGTLHLVGEEGVPRLLQERGHTVQQMQQTIH